MIDGAGTVEGPVSADRPHQLAIDVAHSFTLSHPVRLNLDMQGEASRPSARV